MDHSVRAADLSCVGRLHGRAGLAELTMNTLRAITLALHLVAPGYARNGYPALLARLEREHGIDAILMIADVDGETRWNPSLINETRWGQMVGLAQIRDRNFEACADDGPECEAVRARLLKPRWNLIQAFRLFAWAKNYCTKRGYPSAVHWLQMPRGFDAVRHTTCGHRNGKALPIPKGITWLMKRRRELLDSKSSTKRAKER